MSNWLLLPMNWGWRDCQYWLANQHFETLLTLVRLTIKKVRREYLHVSDNVRSNATITLHHLSSSSFYLFSTCLDTASLSDNQLHPLLGLSSPNGVTYTWISPPKALPRKRTVFSRSQRNQLEAKFQSQKYISKPERMKFARDLGLKDSQVRREVQLGKFFINHWMPEYKGKSLVHQPKDKVA